MFTGIVEEIGKVTAISKTQLSIKAEIVCPDTKIGDSIAINGACLSAVAIKDGILGFDVMQETLARTTLGGLKIGDSVNLERSLRIDSRLGGHFVTGHIDYRGRIIEVLKTGFKVSLPPEFADFVAEKGSIALDGVSLTIASCSRKDFTVYLIPHTLKVTTLGKKKKRDFLNVETDLIAKYLSRQTQKTDLQEALKKYNYI